MIAKAKYKEYSTAYSFLLDCSLKEIKEVFKDYLLHIKISKKELCEVIYNDLNYFGWSDEEIIYEILKNRMEKYILSYIDEGDGYFGVFKIKEDYEEKQ